MDTNNASQVYLINQQANAVELVSASTSGALGNSHSGICNSDANGYYRQCSSVSPDGQYVAFTSNATDLIPSTTNGQWQIYVRDTQSNTTELIAVASNGSTGNSASPAASISGDGRYVVFESKATNLDAIDDDPQADIFVHDRETNTTVLVSRAYDGGAANGVSGAPNISADGSFIVFESGSSNLLVNSTPTSDNHIYRVANPLK